jgi:hypothetical protein
MSFITTLHRHPSLLDLIKTVPTPETIAAEARMILESFIGYCPTPEEISAKGEFRYEFDTGISTGNQFVKIYLAWDGITLRDDFNTAES